MPLLKILYANINFNFDDVDQSTKNSNYQIFIRLTLNFISYRLSKSQLQYVIKEESYLFDILYKSERSF